MQKQLRRLWAVALLLAVSFPAWSQSAEGDAQTALVTGHIFNAATGQPASDVQVTMPYLRLQSNTDGEGTFTFSRVPYGSYQVVVGGLNAAPDTFRISVTGPVVELQPFNITPNDAATGQTSTNIPTIALEESDANSDDDGISGQSVSGLLTASRDPFLNTAAFVWGPYRYQPRGYDRNQQQVLINGAPMNDVETGDAYWSQWGGLNDVFRSRSTTYGLQSSEYTYGGINGSVYFDATAIRQRKQTRVTYSLTNRQYRNRLMLTHSTGLMSNGWAFSASISKRWAKEGYVAGTFYDGYSYYAAASKQIGSKGTLNLTTFGAPTRRGKVAPAIQEAYDLNGSNFYNPNWGYQNGEKRNAKVANSFQPITMLNYEHAVSNKTRWNTTVSYQFGKNGNSTLDWYNADDPRPDYYRNFPSWYQSQGNSAGALEQGAALSGNPDYWMQIHWDDLIAANQLNRRPVINPNGTFNGDSALRSVYVVSNDVDKINKWVFNTNIEHVLSEHVTLSGGISYIGQKTESYRELLDLLGGDYYININQFAERNYVGTAVFNQNDLNNPFQIVKEGDKYYYDYINHFNKAWAFGQANFTYNKTEFFLAANAGFNTFDREGLYRNGLFSEGNESYGRSDLQSFLLYGVKGGATYKLNGRHYLFLNAGLQTDAPTVDNTFVSPRLRNKTVDNPTTQKSYTMEGGYLLRAPKVNARVVGYATDIKDVTEIKRFYNEGNGANTFVNFALSNMNQRFIGTELALDVKVSSSLSLNGVVSLGQAFYTNNPNVNIYRDADTTSTVETKKVYINNYYLAVGPQSAYTFGINYRSKRYWYANLNFNYFDRNYVDVAADRRSAEAVDLLTPGSALWNEILNQQKLPSYFTMDLFAGKSILLSKVYKKLPRNTYLYINAGVSNLLDNKSIITGGFEQLRYDYSDRRAGSFPPKYFYGFGRNFFVNLSLKF